MVEILHPYVHEYDFPFHDYLKSYKDSLIKEYYRRKQGDTKNNDFPLFNHPINNLLVPKLNKIVEENYWVDKTQVNSSLNLYVQNKNTTDFFFHNHAGTMSSMVGVFYVDIPQDGGELTFLLNPPPLNFKSSTDNRQKTFTLKPLKDKLYLFPYWIYHSPTPQTSDTHRLCFNWSHGSNIRPTHKATGIIW